MKARATPETLALSKLLAGHRRRRLAEKDADSAIIDDELRRIRAVSSADGLDAAKAESNGILDHRPMGGPGAKRKIDPALGAPVEALMKSKRIPRKGGPSGGGGTPKKLIECTSRLCVACKMECKSCECKGVGTECGCWSCIAWRKSREGQLPKGARKKHGKRGRRRNHVELSNEWISFRIPNGTKNRFMKKYGEEPTQRAKRRFEEDLKRLDDVG
ncbi:MAG: hypothetical protein WCB99_04165 [Candidatus Cybelea sp.]